MLKNARVTNFTVSELVRKNQHWRGGLHPLPLAPPVQIKVKGKFGEITELTDETNSDDLTYYFKGNTATKRFDNCKMCLYQI